MATATQPPTGAPAPLPMAPPDHTTENIPVNKIVRSPFNRRPTLTDDFVESIRKDGVLQNVIVRSIKANVAHITELLPQSPSAFALGEMIYELVAGERRWLAAKKVGHATIPAVIRELTAGEAMEIQIKENEERENYNPMDRCRAYARLVRQYQEDRNDPKYTHKQAIKDVAERHKKEPRTIYQIIQLENLTPVLKSKLETGEIPVSHGYELCRRSRDEQDTLLQWLTREREHSQGDLPSVRRLKREIEKLGDGQPAVSAQPQKDSRPAPGKYEERTVTKKSQEPARGDGDQTAQSSRAVKDSAAQPPSAVEKISFPIKITVLGASSMLFPGKLPGWLRPHLLKSYPDLQNAHLLKDGRIQLGIGLLGKCEYLSVKELEEKLNGSAGEPAKKASSSGEATQAQIQFHDRSGNVVSPMPRPVDHECQAKPLTAAARKLAEENLERIKRINSKAAQAQRALDARQRKMKIDIAYEAKLFVELAKKGQVNSRSLARVLPDLLYHIFEARLPIQQFCRDVLKWPAPRNGDGYKWNEARAHCQKYTQGFTPGLLLALLINSSYGREKQARIARHFKIDAKKLRQKATAEVKAEERKARETAKTAAKKKGAAA